MILNFAPVLFENDEYHLYCLDYVSDEQLNYLRNHHNKTNSFFRKDNYIYHSPMVTEGGYTEGDLVTCKTSVDIDLTKKLLHHLIFRKILEKNSIMSGFSPIEFFERDKNNDLLKDYLSEDEKKQVGFWRGYKIDTRIINNSNQPIYGLVLNIFHVWKIKINCLSALQLGIDLVNRFVEIYDPEADEIFKTKKVLIGQVVSHDDNMAYVKKGDLSIPFPLNELYLENSSENKEELLEKYLGIDKAKTNLSLLANSIQERAGAKGKLDWLNKFLKSLETIEFNNNNGFSFKIGDFIRSIDNLWSNINLEKPIFIFNDYGNQKDYWHDRGLREYGPFSKESLPISKPKIIVLFRQNRRGGVLEFIGKFKDGLPNIKTSGQNPYQPYGQGFSSKYRIPGFELILYQVEDNSLKSYDKTLRQMIEENESIDLVIVESSHEYKELPKEENPYFLTKAKLLKHGIPSQEVMYENMVLPDRNLAYILNNISLACYAKLGGTPWVIPKDSKVDHEIVIGIGNKMIKDDRFSFNRRIVGITTLFTGDGNFLMGNVSKDIPYEDYLEELNRSLTLNINKLKQRYNWIQGNTIRLVFHTFKPFRHDEIETIEAMVNALKTEFNVLFAYLTVSFFQPFLIFDKNQPGVPDINNYGEIKGIWQPIRGENIKIDNYQRLIQLVGPRELKSWKQGMASPVLIRLHQRSSFDDLDYLSKQIFKFSSISWRSFLPSSLPVTLEYSNQIADLLGNLRESGHWNEDILPEKLKEKAWFL